MDVRIPTYFVSANMGDIIAEIDKLIDEQRKQIKLVGGGGYDQYGYLPSSFTFMHALPATVAVMATLKELGKIKARKMVELLEQKRKVEKKEEEVEVHGHLDDDAAQEEYAAAAEKEEPEHRDEHRDLVTSGRVAILMATKK